MAEQTEKSYLEIVTGSKALTKGTILALQARIADDQKKFNEQQIKINRRMEMIYFFILLFTVINVIIIGLSALINNFPNDTIASWKYGLYLSLVVIVITAVIITVGMGMGFYKELRSSKGNKKRTSNKSWSETFTIDRFIKAFLLSVTFGLGYYFGEFFNILGWFFGLFAVTFIMMLIGGKLLDALYGERNP